jgi:DNA-binding MarR family transcriptional regulator
MQLAPPQLPAETDERQILDSLRRIVRALRRSSREAERRAGTSGAQLFMLELLARSGPWSLGQLAARVHTDQSTASTVVGRLVRRGLVASQRAQEDRRRLVLQVTRRGRALLRRAPEPAQIQLLAALRRLPPGERRSLSRSLERLAQQMAPSDRPAPLFFEDERSPKPRRRRG